MKSGHRRLVVLFLVQWVVVFLLAPGVAPAASLFSEEEMRLLQYSEEEWVDELYQFRLDSRAHSKMGSGTRGFGSTGPQVSILTPERAGDHYRAPIPLLVFFQKCTAPIDIESLDVRGKKGFLTVNITDRIRTFLRKPQQGEDADFVIDAEIPRIGTGRYLIIMSLADIEGNREEHQAFLEVVNN